MQGAKYDCSFMEATMMQLHESKEQLNRLKVSGSTAGRFLRSSAWMWPIEGTVTDSSGALVVGAKVAAQNTATGASRRFAAPPTAAFTHFSPLDAGDYTITVVSATGFENLVRENIHLDGMQVLVTQSDAARSAQ
jgi:hypothetical protein